MSQSSNEDLRRLLAEAMNTNSPRKSTSRASAEAIQLESMIEALGNDLYQSSSNAAVLPKVKPSVASETQSLASSNSFNTRWKQTNSTSDDSFSDRQHEVQSVSASTSGNENKEKDVLDYTVIRFGSDYVLRGKMGRYLAAVPVASEPTANVAHSTKVNVNTGISTLEINGQGVGEPIDCLNFVNADKKEDFGYIRYGATVALKSPAAKERLLGSKDGRLGFWRHLFGQGEKFMILKANTTVTSGTSASVGGSGSRGIEEPGSRGKFVRIGDTVLIQTANEQQLLSLYEGINGIEARLVFKDRTGLGSELWQLEQFGAVPLPAWYHNRPYLSGKYLAIPPSNRLTHTEIEARHFPRSNGILRDQPLPPPPPLSSMTVSAQHLVLARDLLTILAGVEGQHIRVAAPPTSTGNASEAERYVRGANAAPKNQLKVCDITLMIDVDSADKSTVSQVMLLFPIAESALRIREFIRLHSRYEFGFVSHALCGSLKKIMREFDILIAQLEHMHVCGKLSLQKLLFLLQPSKTSLTTLDRLTKRLMNSVGGHMLDILHGCMLEQGDSQSRDLHHYLLKQASVPFLKMLSLWIFRGELQDPYKEFMIFEDTSVSKEALEEDFNAQYWETRYTLREEHIPRILKSHANKALIAGKYLHVVRGCVAGSTNSSSNRYNNNFTAVDTSKYSTTKEEWRLPEEKELVLSLDLSDNSLSREIEDAYLFSSRALLKLLEVNHKLSTHVTSLRRFFLLEHGDFFIQFMDTAEIDLRREVGEVVLSRIQGLLQLAVQTSTLALDPNREDLSCTLASHNLIQHLHLIQSAGDGTNTASIYGNTSQGLKGVEAFTLDYRVGWPLSIILSKRAITKYQLLSRLLYFSKHVERRVLTSWMGHQQTKELNVRAQMSAGYCLRHRMLHFLQNFVYYMTFEVIHPHSHELSEAMKYAEDMDEVITQHERFLDTCLNECLLASQDLLRILTKLMNSCLMFADRMNEFTAEWEREVQNVGQEEVRVTSKRVLKRGDSKSAMSSSSQQIKEDAVTQAMSVASKVKNMRNKAHAECIRRETSRESFHKILEKFAKTFDEQLKEFLDKLCTDSYRNHGQLSNLCVRLDYNGFYSSEFAADRLF